MDRETPYPITDEDYRRLFNHVGCGVFISSKEGRYLDVNPGLVTMLGYDDKEELLSVDIAADLYQVPEDRAAYQKRMDEDGRVIDYEVNLKKKNGEPLHVLITCHPRFDANGDALGYEGIVVDLDERLRMERRLRRTQQQLLQSEKLAAMGRLTSQLAHELNNPLFGIMNTMELVKAEFPEGNRRRKLLDMSISEIMKMADLLKKMLAFSKPVTREKEDIDVHLHINDVLSLHQKSFTENNIKLESDFARSPAMIHASGEQVRQVMLNLISNAKEAMPNGGTLSISTLVKKDEVQIIVQDSGVGIEKENLAKVFDSFFTTKKDRVQGVGLGLSVCYGIITDHQGWIEVASEPDQGARFMITLPRVL
ncbi:MAG: ATP-binding protein [Desulfobacterales bacterium]|nr:ATP-binding protein [Desulfobacterales bacterium]